jgi:hypothetical protein
MRSLSLFTWIGNAAAALTGRHGAVSQQAHTVACSRQTVYDHAAKVQQALLDAHRPGPSRAALLQEVQQLRDENRQLWQWLEHTIDCAPDKRRQFTVTAAAMGLSLQQTLTLLALLLPARLLPSRPTLGRWVRRSAQRAHRLLQRLDRACQHLVVCLCLDEIFLHRQPVLMGVEPHSFAWVLGQRSSDRSGPTWAQALAAWPHVEDIAADGGSGIELGLRLTAGKRQEQARHAQGETVALRVRLDLFHIRRDGARVLRLLWAQAEARWEEAEHLDRAKARFDRSGGDGRHFKQNTLSKAWAVAVAAFELAQQQEQAWARAVAALQVFRPDGPLNDRAWAESELCAAAAVLSGPRWAKVRRMLLDPRALTFLERLHEELAAVEPCPERREALAALWRWQRERRSEARGATAQAVLAEVWPALVRRCLGENWETAYRRVSRVLRRVVRASSAVECVNSVVRMHQARHRRLTQELLDLKRLYWNCRSFVGGKRRGACPYAHLGLKLPTYDPWVLLQMEPKELEQQLSSSRLAA